jgi:hypothetical protein
MLQPTPLNKDLVSRSEFEVREKVTYSSGLVGILDNEC